MHKPKCTAIVLAGGSGKRMGTKVQKQYLEIDEKPVLFYSLNEFQRSDVIDDIILVVGEGQEEYCQSEIVNKYDITKVRHIVVGGKERFHSVWNGLQRVKGPGYVFIHDGARPFVDEEMIERVYREVQIYKACVVGMPVKDTIKIADEAEYALETPDRSRVWMIQTPQVFEVELVKRSYETLISLPEAFATDDAMVVESYSDCKVKLVQGSYENIKITTPEDMGIAELFAMKRKK